MTGIFSTISGVFGRAMIIGALLPATLFVLFVYLVLMPMLPWEWAFVARLEAIAPEWKIAGVAVLAVILAGLLDVLNIPIVRFYEGYPWGDGLLGRFLTKQQAKRYTAAQKRRNDALELRKQLRNNEKERIGKLDAVHGDVLREEMEIYPLEHLLLPTRLGNIIRSFETYPYRQYRIAGVALWPRFYSRLSAAHMKEVEEARTSFNVTIHLSFLSLLAMLLILAAGCVYPIPFASWALAKAWGGLLVAAGALAWLFYLSSLYTAGQWGHVVRAAFDLHRHEVLRDFGISPLPRDLESERSIWDRVSSQIIYGDSHEPRLHLDAATITLPENSYIDVTRSVLPAVEGGVRTVRLHVRNRGGDTDGVRVVEHLPAGSDLVWNSASVRVYGTNPYYFVLGMMPSDVSTVIEYKIVVAKG
jgi:hypothetical protein